MQLENRKIAGTHLDSVINVANGFLCNANVSATVITASESHADGLGQVDLQVFVAPKHAGSTERGCSETQTVERTV